ncbi:MAG: hypothetical protein ACYTEQ_26400 [Planctomycetota bacterium]|jgi:hypothetical protein
MSQDIQTQADYARYQADVERGLEGLEAVSSGPCPGCQKCADSHGTTLERFEEAYEAGEICAEPHFSWHSCECCGGTLGGEREEAHGWRGEELVHFTICTDCAYYIEYGKLDDMTMVRLGLDE